MQHRFRRGLFLLGLSLSLVACRIGAPGNPAASDVAFEDDFSDPLSGQWQLEGDQLGQTAIVDGRLLLKVNTPATVQYVTLENRVFSDFIVEVDATQVGGSAGSSYGLLLRMAAPGQFYRFEITGNGEYVVERHDGPANWVRLTDVTNHLRVIAAGGTFSFYVNDTLLAQIADKTYAAGAIALDAGTFNQSELQVAFDNLVVNLP